MNGDRLNVDWLGCAIREETKSSTVHDHVAAIVGKVWEPNFTIFDVRH